MDRNAIITKASGNLIRSLSARRAWIEIRLFAWITQRTLVALRKESVDRNYQANAVDQILPVALRKESVDRNGMF